MSFVEIMVFHLMAHTKKIDAMEYHDTKSVVSGMVSASGSVSASPCATQHHRLNLSDENVRMAGLGKAKQKKAAGGAPAAFV
jgi:hypothetical protein